MEELKAKNASLLQRIAQLEAQLEGTLRQTEVTEVGEDALSRAST